MSTVSPTTPGVEGASPTFVLNTADGDSHKFSLSALKISSGLLSPLVTVSAVVTASDVSWPIATVMTVASVANSLSAAIWAKNAVVLRSKDITVLTGLGGAASLLTGGLMMTGTAILTLLELRDKPEILVSMSLIAIGANYCVQSIVAEAEICANNAQEAADAIGLSDLDSRGRVARTN